MRNRWAVYIVATAVMLVAFRIFWGLLEHRSDPVATDTPEGRSGSLESLREDESGIDDAPEQEIVYFSEESTGGYTIHGRVLNASDVPISFARLDLEGGIRASIDTDASGGFALTDVPAGRYDIELSHPRYKSVRKRITVRGDRSFDFRMGWVSLKGHVSDPGVDIPIKSFTVGWVNLEHPNDTPSDKKVFYRSQGDFVLEYADFRYDAIGISARGYENKVVGIEEFDRVDDALAASIVLTPMDGVVGKVVDEQDRYREPNTSVGNRSFPCIEDIGRLTVENFSKISAPSSLSETFQPI